jgi:hypothetical protein
MLRVSHPSSVGSKSSVMVAQHDVSVRKDQWYRISFRARAEDPVPDNVLVTITNMASWRSLLEYQRFQPTGQWQSYRFQVQANDTVAENTRFQIWFDGPGKICLADVRVEPIADPTVGRWLEGLYLDTPERWDDPYRFFRW